MKKTVRQALMPLVGLPLRNISRSGNMLCVHFGNTYAIPDRGGTTQAVPEWTIQIQCAWRVSQGTRIVIAYRDFYYSDIPLSNLAVMSKSRFNVVLDSLCAEFEAMPPVVGAVEADDTGGFSVQMSHDYKLEVFPSESPESGKHWRVFQPVPEGKSFVFPPNETQ